MGLEDEYIELPKTPDGHRQVRHTGPVGGIIEPGSRPTPDNFGLDHRKEPRKMMNLSPMSRSSLAGLIVAAALQAQGFPVLPDHILLDPPIRTLDNRVVTLEFTEEISTQVKVWVVREGGATDGEHPGEPQPDDAGEVPAAEE